MEFNKNYKVTVVGKSHASLAPQFETGDIVSFKETERGIKIVKNGRQLKGYVTKTNLRFFGKSHLLEPLTSQSINHKVVTKAVAWGMKTFGADAPTDGQQVVDTMIQTGLNEFNSVARIAHINQRQARK